MASTWARAARVLLTAIACLSIAASPGLAQTDLASLEELRRDLAAGDVIAVVTSQGEPVDGRLIRLGQHDLDVRVETSRAPHGRGPRDVTVDFASIQSLERRRDPARNGAAIGAGIGAGLGGSLFVYALSIDRNEIDEWSGFYLGATAVYTGLGALLGWALDAAHSKPHIRFDAASRPRAQLMVGPTYSRGRGIALTVTLSR